MYTTPQSTTTRFSSGQPEAESAATAADEEVVDFFFVFVMVWLVLWGAELPIHATPELLRPKNLHGTKICTFLPVGTKNSTRTNYGGT